MWVNRQFFTMLIDDNKRQQDEIVALSKNVAALQTIIIEARPQKAKDDNTIDWMRHRVNALEKQNAQLLAKAAGIFVPVPEIVPTRPGSINGLPPDFDSMPSFEDVGDSEATRLGLAHDESGAVVFTK